MKSVRLFLLLAAAAMIAVAPSFAFHSGGVAECGGCHSMHSSPQTTGSLLVNTDKSSTCLSCHEGTPGSYHVSTPDTAQPAGDPPDQLTPGGDFGWVKKTFTYVLRGNTVTEMGERHGHNVIALDFGYYTDTTNATSPGGSYPATGMSCISCHDPHGKSRRLLDGTIVNPAIGTNSLPIAASGSYPAATNQPTASYAVGVYRILGGPGYTDGLGTAFPGAPAALVPSTYNRTEAATITRAAYGNVSGSGSATWGAWCGNCHAAMNNGMSLEGGEVHPIDEDMNGLAALYNAYRGSGNMGGTVTDAYSSLTPFAETNPGGAAQLYAQLAPHATNNTNTSTVDKSWVKS